MEKWTVDWKAWKDLSGPKAYVIAVLIEPIFPKKVSPDSLDELFFFDKMRIGWKHSNVFERLYVNSNKI